MLNRWERQGWECGLAQGWVEGGALAILRVLARKGTTLDPATEGRIRGLDQEPLLALADALLDLERRTDLDA